MFNIFQLALTPSGPFQSSHHLGNPREKVFFRRWIALGSNGLVCTMRLPKGDNNILIKRIVIENVNVCQSEMIFVFLFSVSRDTQIPSVQD
jgi:hypothetical protein